MMNNYTQLLTTSGRTVLPYATVDTMRRKNSKLADDRIFAAQYGPQERALSSNVDILITGGNRGGGKANSCNAPVVTPDGFKKMGDLAVGDKICTPWDGVQEVTAIFEQGRHKTYSFRFDDGSSSVVMANHRFWAKAPWEDKYAVYTAEEIMKHYALDRKGYYALRAGKEGLYEIPLPPPVEYETGDTIKNLPIHPEVLGMIMGRGIVHFTKYGAELPRVAPYMSRMLYTLGYFLKTVHKGTRLKGYVAMIPDDARREVTKQRRPVPAVIPDKYLYADVESRIALIQGIISVNNLFARGKFYGGNPYIKAPNRKFITQIAQVCRSLGWWAGVTSETDMATGEEFWQVLIVAPDNNVPCRYANRHGSDHLINGEIPQNKNSINGLTKKIIGISSGEKVECRCITVSGKDHLYMTDGFTINHNTFTLLMDALYDIDNSRFNAIIFRKEKDDLKNIIRDSQSLYKGEGVYNRSRDDMTWYFNSGAMLSLTYYDGQYKDFLERFQGRQYSYIGIDEITQMGYAKFKYLITTNRNAAGIRNRVIGTCNPDPLSWVRTFIGWWIGADGYPIKERDGVVRYCYMKGDDVTQIVWGDTREEVYEQCKDEIDELWGATWGDTLPPVGYTPERMFTKSVTFIRAELKYNRILTDNDPSYFANLAQQSDEQKARDMMGNWDFMATGDDMIKMKDLQACFSNAQQTGDNIKRVSCDVAFTGGDQCVMWLWRGWHVQDIHVCKLNSKDTVTVVKAKLGEWGVTESNFTYDLNGLGQTFRGFFQHAIPFNNLEAVKPKFKNVYDNIKSQCAYEFAQKILEGEISFNPKILNRKFNGKGYKNKPLRDILQIERKCIRQDAEKMDKGWCLIKKAQMKQLVGHSPDFFEALIMRMIFELKHAVVEIPQWAKYF